MDTNFCIAIEIDKLLLSMFGCVKFATLYTMLQLELTTKTERLTISGRLCCTPEHNRIALCRTNRETMEEKKHLTISNIDPVCDSYIVNY